jgi:hypothetical protein
MIASAALQPLTTSGTPSEKRLTRRFRQLSRSRIQGRWALFAFGIRRQMSWVCSHGAY